MTALTVYINGAPKELTEQDVRKMLIKRALDVARNERVRWHLSEVGRAIQSITNQVYEGRQRALKNWDYIGDPFPEAFKLKVILANLLQNYCMKQETMTREAWEAGWETEVVPQIQALQ